MRTENFEIHVPVELIAQVPIEPRDHSKLLVINKKTKSVHSGLFFYDLPSLFHAGDLLVFNNSRVIPARLKGHRTGNPMEKIVILLLHKSNSIWTALIEVGEVEPGDWISLTPSEFRAQVVSRRERIGKRKEMLVYLMLENEDKYLEQAGEPPIPPYIHGYQGNPERYQTVYAEIRGSAAAPTAGLHFSNRLLEELNSYGVNFAFVTLHIGVDTFMPILEEKIEDHKIYSEYMEVPLETCEIIKETRANKKKVVCVGTTVVRALETCNLEPFIGWTSKYITPGYKFKVVDDLITNFHYPRSTNLVLVSALAGRELIRKAYEEAIKLRYRFYSFGDSCWIRG